VFLRLACCGLKVRSDRGMLAATHYSACMYRTLAADAGWKVTPAARLDPDRAYTRDITVRQPRVRSALSEPMVIASNGKRGADRRNKLMPWSTAIQHLASTGVPKTCDSQRILNHEL
jgi:hypothetical protein